MQAIILAAGMGKRLKELTKNNTKCMVKVNGTTLIKRMLNQIDSHAFSKIIIVVGYEGQSLIDYINTLNIKTPITYIENEIYDKTNNIYSLSLAKDYLCQEDTILFESDIIFEDAVLDMLIDDERDTLALVDKYESWMDGTCVKLSDKDEIIAFVPGKCFNYTEKDEYYKTVNLYKFSRKFSQEKYVPFLEAYQKAFGLNEYYEQVLRVISMLDISGIKAKRLNGQKWYEIDDIQDLDIAESIFTDDPVSKIQCRYGGYWRYPKLLDFYYLVNPYYPTTRMKDELRSNFDTLLTQYPSGMKVNCLLASKNFNVPQDNIVVGNGAAELIKSLMSNLKGTTGFIRPTFEEYPNRTDDYMVFVPENKDYLYTVDDIIDFFSGKSISNLVLINPDNPSGNFIDKKNIMKLVYWCIDQNIKLIVDESFLDFADDNESIMQDIINYANIYVVKSISKSYGVPGLRLGIIVSGDVDTLNILKKDVAIWNINSFAEYYMQIAEKYKKDYIKALDLFKEERSRLIAELSKIKQLRLIPTQANFIMIDLGDYSSEQLMKTLLKDYNIFIKDLSNKTGKNYIRIAIRNTEDNNKLIQALNEIF